MKSIVSRNDYCPKKDKNNQTNWDRILTAGRLATFAVTHSTAAYNTSVAIAMMNELKVDLYLWPLSSDIGRTRFCVLILVCSFIM